MRKFLKTLGVILMAMTGLCAIVYTIGSSEIIKNGGLFGFNFGIVLSVLLFFLGVWLFKIGNKNKVATSSPSSEKEKISNEKKLGDDMKPAEDVKPAENVKTIENKQPLDGSEKADAVKENAEEKKGTSSEKASVKNKAENRAADRKIETVVSRYDMLKSFAKSVVIKAAETDNLDKVLGGIGLYNVETIDAIREKTLAVEPIVSSIYELYNEKPELDVANKTYEGIKLLFEKAKSAHPIDNALNILKYILYSQANGKASFTIDCRELLAFLSKRLQEEKDLPQREGFVEENFAEILASHEKYIEDYFGIRMKELAGSSNDEAEPQTDIDQKNEEKHAGSVKPDIGASNKKTKKSEDYGEAYHKLEMAIEKNELRDFLLQDPRYSVYIEDRNFPTFPDHISIGDAICTYVHNNPDSKEMIKSKIEELLTNVKNGTGRPYFSFVSIITEIVECKRDIENLFDDNTWRLLKEAVEKIKDIKDIISEHELKIIEGTWKMIQQRHELAKNNDDKKGNDEN